MEHAYPSIHGQVPCHPKPHGETVSVMACFKPRHDPSHNEIRRGPNRLDPFLERLVGPQTINIGHCCLCFAVLWKTMAMDGKTGLRH